jgi:putative ABC transport system permease protein
VLGTLAVAFAVEVVTFVATYGTAKHADAQAAFGSDLRITPGDPLTTLPPLGPNVASVSAMREVPARAETDRKTILAIDLATYSKTATISPRIDSGGGVAALVQDPMGILIDPTIAADFAVGPGDNLPLTLFPDDIDLSQNLTFHVVGIFRDFPPSNPYAEMVMSTAGLPPYLVPPADFYLARDAAGQPPSAVAGELSNNPAIHKKFAVSTLADQKAVGPRSLTALNLDGLKRIEAIGAGLIAAIGVAVLGAFLVLERRREFAVLEAVGAETSQVIEGPAQEGIITVLGSLFIGLPLGLGLGILSVRVLGLFFSLQPPLLTVPVGTLAAFVLLMVATSAVALGVALVAVTRVRAATVLREP